MIRRFAAFLGIVMLLALDALLIWEVRDHRLGTRGQRQNDEIFSKTRV